MPQYIVKQYQYIVPRNFGRFWGKIGIFGAGKKMPNIKQLGLYALLSYGFVSNISYVTCVSMAWFTTSKKTGWYGMVWYGMYKSLYGMYCVYESLIYLILT